MLDFKVSVIIPVHNRSGFLTKAVNSVLGIPDVGEIIIVDDGSTDDSLKVAETLRSRDLRVKVWQHQNGANRGVSASRNLGILKSSMPFIAFLDSDDWYLENRFKSDQIIFSKFPQADAVFSPTILEEDRADYSKIRGLGYDLRKRLGYEVSPEFFYKKLSSINRPLFHTNSVTFKKDFLLKDKLFDERLKLHEDSELWKRTMRRGNFFHGEIDKPVSVIRRHQGNVITSRNFNSDLKFNAVFIDNVGIQNLFHFEINSLFKRILRKKSKKIGNNWRRRLYYYSNYMRFCYRKKELLRKVKEEYKDLKN